MSQLIDVDLAKCYRLLNHGPTVLVTSCFDGKHNVMAAAWAMPLDFDPPKILVVIDKTTYSRQLIDPEHSMPRPGCTGIKSRQRQWHPG